MTEKRESDIRIVKESRGFTLIEMMIALFILSVGILGLLAVHATTTKTNFKANRMTVAATENSDRQEKLLAGGYDDAAFSPGAAAPIVDGRYTITWTVSAAGVPIPNVKTVTIKTAWKENGQDRSVEYIYYKAKSF